MKLTEATIALFTIVAFSSLEVSAHGEQCAAISDNFERLNCYDALEGNSNIGQPSFPLYDGYYANVRGEYSELFLHNAFVSFMDNTITVKNVINRSFQDYDTSFKSVFIRGELAVGTEVWIEPLKTKTSNGEKVPVLTRNGVISLKSRQVGPNAYLHEIPEGSLTPKKCYILAFNFLLTAHAVPFCIS